MKRLFSLALVVLTACSSAPVVSRDPSTAPREVTNAASSSGEEVFMPAPDRPVPRHAWRTANQLEKVTRALRDSVDAWVESGDLMERRPPRAVVLQSLYQQRIYRKLARNDRLAKRTINQLSKRLARVARAHRRAAVGLRGLVRPVDPDDIRTGRSAAAGRLLQFYKEGQRRFGVAWEVLAAVNFIETKFNKIRSPSYADAQGPMQFLRSTWDSYGMGGNIYGNHDSIMGAANYLHASGAPDDYRGALYNYNHSDAYVNAVLVYAHRIMHDPRYYFQYYNWQLYVFTKHGDVRLTGPGT
ncbi:MAG: hypothetical protein QOH26_2231 [Actinomycetota bacterium]|nr:hypothetical protein [Actinomycetota bacterium]